MSQYLFSRSGVQASSNVMSSAAGGGRSCLLACLNPRLSWSANTIDTNTSEPSRSSSASGHTQFSKHSQRYLDTIAEVCAVGCDELKDLPERGAFDGNFLTDQLLEVHENGPVTECCDLGEMAIIRMSRVICIFQCFSEKVFGFKVCLLNATGMLIFSVCREVAIVFGEKGAQRVPSEHHCCDELVGDALVARVAVISRPRPRCKQISKRRVHGVSLDHAVHSRAVALACVWSSCWQASETSSTYSRKHDQRVAHMSYVGCWQISFG